MWKDILTDATLVVRIRSSDGLWMSGKIVLWFIVAKLH